MVVTYTEFLIFRIYDLYILGKINVVKNCLLGISPASEHYKPTFRNSVSVPSSAGGEV